MNIPANTIVLDLETARSADDCRHCGASTAALRSDVCTAGLHEPIGWDNKPALGLSVGCAWSYADQRMIWFDEHTLQSIMERWVAEQAYLVGYNHIAFDAPLMRGILRRWAETLPSEEGQTLVQLCDDFKALCTTSYDILAEIWKAAPADKFARGLNSLDAIAQANGLGGKTGHGAQAPRDWAAGRWASVLNYCSNDVYLTKALWELIVAGAPIQRSNGTALLLRQPFSPAGPLASAPRLRFNDELDYAIEAL